MAKYCPAGACRLCGIQGHNTSICPQLSGPPRRQPNTAPDKPVSQSKGPTKKRLLTRNSVATKVHTRYYGRQTTVLRKRTLREASASNIIHQGSSASVHILVGQAYVRNTRDQALETIHVMLDTGADRSFISNELADRLQLQNVSTVELTINTFGSSEPLKRTCGVTELLFKRLQNFFESKNAHSALRQLSTERSSRIQYSSRRPTTRAARAPPEEERIKRQLRETERELETVEKELVGVRNAIEAEWEPDDDEKEVSHERLDRLRRKKTASSKLNKAPTRAGKKTVAWPIGKGT
ncbi:hypothetical protein COOONC_26556 [Cooperia oncophora]